jgi:hypothetical protein
MEFFKDGKYIIGFLVGVICSFIIMGGTNNYKEGNVSTDTEDNLIEESVLVDENKIEGQEVLVTESNNNSTVGEVVINNQSVLSPETPHSPQLQRLALILRETERMVNRLKKEMRAVEIKQQTASLLDQM